MGYLAFLFEVHWSLRVSAAGDVTGLLQSLVEARDVLFHFFQRRQQRLGLFQQRQTSLPYLTTGKDDASCKPQVHDASLTTNSIIFHEKHCTPGAKHKMKQVFSVQLPSLFAKGP